MSLQLRNIRLPLADFALETDAMFDQPITVFAGRSLEQCSSTTR